MRRATRGLLLAAAGMGAVLLGGLAVNAASTQQPPAPRGKIAPWEAMKIATGKVPGRALNADFEFDEGHWIYGVFVVSGKSIKEVEIDPMTGKVGDVEDVKPEEEAKELVETLNAAISGKPAPPEKNEKGEKGEKDEKK